MSGGSGSKLSKDVALRLEYSIIGFGIVALIMIFQPFSLTIFSIGCGLVVVAALINNLLPLAVAGAPVRIIPFATAVVALILCTALLVAIAAAHLYGLAFLKAPAVSLVRRAASAPFYQQPLVWGLAVIDIILWFAVFRLRGDKGE
ncbi:MAG: hypothetical protein GKR97_07440 [Rhizobiaceae bacterium]|nr:hypothetical protein [Rhizobiaceae bacterium]